MRQVQKHQGRWRQAEQRESGVGREQHTTEGKARIKLGLRSGGSCRINPGVCSWTSATLRAHAALTYTAGAHSSRGGSLPNKILIRWGQGLGYRCACLPQVVRQRLLQCCSQLPCRGLLEERHSRGAAATSFQLVSKAHRCQLPASSRAWCPSNAPGSQRVLTSIQQQCTTRRGLPHAQRAAQVAQV